MVHQGELALIQEVNESEHELYADKDKIEEILSQSFNALAPKKEESKKRAQVSLADGL